VTSELTFGDYCSRVCLWHIVVLAMPISYYATWQHAMWNLGKPELY